MKSFDGWWKETLSDFRHIELVENPSSGWKWQTLWGIQGPLAMLQVRLCGSDCDLHAWKNSTYYIEVNEYLVNVLVEIRKKLWLGLCFFSCHVPLFGSWSWCTEDLVMETGRAFNDPKIGVNQFSEFLLECTLGSLKASLPNDSWIKDVNYANGDAWAV